MKLFEQWKRTIADNHKTTEYKPSDFPFDKGNKVINPQELRAERFNQEKKRFV